MTLVEHFVSPQGEGQNTGINTLFIRVFGCNLDCSFCDEPKHKDTSFAKEYSIEDIVSLAMSERTEWVCITGGEPTLHNLRPLIGALQAVDFKVQVETNGYNLSMCDNADLVTLSPKGNSIPNGRYDEVKILIPVQEDLLPVRGRVYLQPVNWQHTVDMDNVQKCLKLLQKYPHYGLSVQMHKLIGVE